MYSNEVPCRPLTLAESGVRISNADVAIYVCSRKLSQPGQEFVPQTGHPLVQLALLYLSWRQLLFASKDHAIVVLRRRPLPRQPVSERPGAIGIPELVRSSRFTDTVYILCIYLHIHAVKNATFCQIVALINIQLHVSAL